jgi:hypothetical protein
MTYSLRALVSATLYIAVIIGLYEKWQEYMWWRRRELNPHPKVATSEIYTLSQFTFISPKESM